MSAECPLQVPLVPTVTGAARGPAAASREQHRQGREAAAGRSPHYFRLSLSIRYMLNIHVS